MSVAVHIESAKVTPDMLDRNSCKVNVAGMLRGLSMSSGTSFGRGRVARMAFLALTISEGSSDFRPGKLP